jgi:hypothetical protein
VRLDVVVYVTLIAMVSERVAHGSKPTATSVYSVRPHGRTAAGGWPQNEFEYEYESYLREKFFGPNTTTLPLTLLMIASNASRSTQRASRSLSGRSR